MVARCTVTGIRTARPTRLQKGEQDPVLEFGLSRATILVSETTSLLALLSEPSNPEMPPKTGGTRARAVNLLRVNVAVLAAGPPAALAACSTSVPAHEVGRLTLTVPVRPVATICLVMPLAACAGWLWQNYFGEPVSPVGHLARGIERRFPAR